MIILVREGHTQKCRHLTANPNAILGLRISRTLLADRQLQRDIGNYIGYAGQTTEIDFVEIISWPVIIVVQPGKEKQYRNPAS